MRILMLGWEFPPFVAGGLGTACHGLTKALDRAGHDVTFVLPRKLDRSRQAAAPMRVVGVGDALPVDGRAGPDDARAPAGGDGLGQGELGPGGRAISIPGFDRTEFVAIDSGFASPYPGGHAGGVGAGFGADAAGGSGMMQPIPMSALEAPHELEALRGAGVSGDKLAEGDPSAWQGAPEHGYGEDVVGDTERYARMVVGMCRGRNFDVVHAHDWMTIPAGLAAAKVLDRPLVVHVHATEFDRSGDHVDQRVYDIERRGLHLADRVVCVSEYTKSICTGRYDAPAHKIDVVYNGVEAEVDDGHREFKVKQGDHVVLFLGRITMQKGPEYFVRAAKRVLEKVEDVKFVIAGSGDMAKRIVEEAAFLGIGHRVLFTGFLRGSDVDRAYRMADCYVMPSVSEPFGIAPLEAMRNDVPVIISKQSGVSEVLTHALKIDFWDIDEMANKIVAVLKHAPLSQTLRQNQPHELKGLTWDASARNVVASYGAAIAEARIG
ncbi:MAG: glycosyltransferase family 4 protein [Planctomycetota bacterium]